ncbi:YpmS family protein [Shouchella lonarensis]|uniref:YpmS family protein n=1 Tax=Shouchella lonarensis TaxID=1464122 RepID=UPI00159FD06A|nr:YpmS family protein [Shouchella lonarensis]
MASRQQKKKNGRFYQYGFYVVCTILVVITVTVIFFFSRLFAVQEGHLPSSEYESETVVDMTFTREEVNKFLGHLMKQDGDMHGQFSLTDEDVRFYGEIDTVVSTIDIAMTFTPEVQTDGSLLLRAHTLSAGQLSLSPEYALRMFMATGEWPDWLEILPEEEALVLHLQNIEALFPYGVYVKEIDLPGDRVELSIQKVLDEK